MVPTKKDRLVDDVEDDVEEMEKKDLHALTDEDKKKFYLWSHQIKKLQITAGKPYEKYRFPATRNQELGWWLVDASERMKKQGEKSDGKFDPANLNTLLDVKLGRVRK